MKNPSIHPTSLLLGAAGAALLGLLLGAARTPASPAPAQAGRAQYDLQVEQGEGVFLVNTASGQVWHRSGDDWQALPIPK